MNKHVIAVIPRDKAPKQYQHLYESKRSGRPQKYPWDSLQKRGDHFLIPDKLVEEVSPLVRFRMRKLKQQGTEALIRALTVPDGVLVFLAYIDVEPQAQLEIVDEDKNAEIFDDEDPDADIREYLDEPVED